MAQSGCGHDPSSFDRCHSDSPARGKSAATWRSTLDGEADAGPNGASPFIGALHDVYFRQLFCELLRRRR
jgi:hypothetical protein